MPECANCGSFVSEAYARVFTPQNANQPRACPYCEDKIREGGKIRDARGPRRVEQRKSRAN